MGRARLAAAVRLAAGRSHPYTQTGRSAARNHLPCPTAPLPLHPDPGKVLYSPLSHPWRLLTHPRASDTRIWRHAGRNKTAHQYPGECTNPEMIADNLVITKVVVAVSPTFGECERAPLLPSRSLAPSLPRFRSLARPPRPLAPLLALWLSRLLARLLAPFSLSGLLARLLARPPRWRLTPPDSAPPGRGLPYDSSFPRWQTGSATSASTRPSR